MTGHWLEAVFDLARPVFRALMRSPAAVLDAEMGDCQKDKDVLGCEVWRNHTERVWFVKCTVCPGAGALHPSRSLAEYWALSHWQSTHR